jgi:SRSO17 transposase
MSYEDIVVAQKKRDMTWRKKGPRRKKGRRPETNYLQNSRRSARRSNLGDPSVEYEWLLFSFRFIDSSEM